MKKRLFYKCILSAAFLTCTLPVLYGHMTAHAEDAKIDSAQAAVMRMMKAEGDVEVSNSSGKSISLIDNMSLYNGYHTETQESSYAWINLDSEKLTKLDAVSEAEVRKSGKKLELLLESGNLFFNVTDDLTEDETMNIRTSTMIMGIRGTSGWVKSIDSGHTKVYILEGTVECIAADPVTGQFKKVTLHSGECADFLSYPAGQDGDKCSITAQKYTEEDIDGFVLTDLVQDDSLCEEIKDASGLDILSLKDTAQQRLEDDEAEMRQIMDEINTKLENQEHLVSRSSVWKREPDPGNTGMAGIPEAIVNTGNDSYLPAEAAVDTEQEPAQESSVPATSSRPSTVTGACSGDPSWFDPRPGHVSGACSGDPTHFNPWTKPTPRPTPDDNSWENPGNIFNFNPDQPIED